MCSCPWFCKTTSHAQKRIQTQKHCELCAKDSPLVAVYSRQLCAEALRASPPARLPVAVATPPVIRFGCGVWGIGMAAGRAQVRAKYASRRSKKPAPP